MVDFRKEANEIKNELIDIKRDIHMHPEVGFEEVRTSTLIKDFLKNEGIEYTSVAGTGVCGIIRGTKEGSGKTIGIRADMDALPIQDNKVCASIMIKEGALENPKVDRVIGLHVTEDLECGKIRIKKGVVNAASNPYKIKIKGSGGHGAAPSATVDTIVIGANVVSVLQTIVSREISAVNPAVITVGSFHGGTAQNIIPEEVELSGIIRTMTVEDRAFACRRLKEIAEGTAMTARGSAEVFIEESMGVESFAYFAMERPSAFYFLGTGNKEKGTDKSAHSSLFDIDEDALPLGVAIQCQSALDYLTME